MNIAKYIDHTFLKCSGDRDAVVRLCREAKRHGFASVCVNGSEVPLAKSILKDSGVKICTVIGFPLGQSTTFAKTCEATEAIANGADELDFVVNVRLLKYDREACLEELRQLVAACRRAPRPIVAKLILECCELDDAEKRAGCALAKKAGFDFVKTSTGFGLGGATVHDVQLMRSCVGRDMGVKAAGGIRTRADALAMIRAGASRIGSSAGAALLK